MDEIRNSRFDYAVDNYKRMIRRLEIILESKFEDPCLNRYFIDYLCRDRIFLTS